MQHVALHDPPHLLGRWRQFVDAADDVHRFGGGEMVTDRADATEPLHDHRHLPQEASADEPLKAAEFNDVEPCLVDIAVAVEMDRHLSVALDTGHGRDFYQSRLSHAPESPKV